VNAPKNGDHGSPGMSTEEAVRRLKSDPEYSALMHDIYADDDVLQAALRFTRSEEFIAVTTWAARHKHFPPARVLDLGAGRGIASLAWALRGYTVTALEPDASNLVGRGAIHDIRERTGVPIEVRNGTGEDLPLDDAFYDVVYTRQVLHHAADLVSMCRSMARVMRPGGLLIATREHVVTDRLELELFWRNHPVHQLAGGEMAYELSNYIDAVHAAGFEAIRAYGPWDTVVNHFPVSSVEVRHQWTRPLVSLLGSRVGEQISARPLYEKWWRRRRSSADKTPGRLYSFVAMRPK
jgi:SAM-dependent methyltransferase